MVRVLFLILMAVHGLIHLLGFVKAFAPADVPQLTQAIGRPSGLLWLVVSLLFVAAAALMFFHVRTWWMAAALAIVCSQALILFSWQDARFGTIANCMVLPVVIAAWAQWNFENRCDAELRAFLPQHAAPRRVVTREMTADLPPVVQRWLGRSGVIGKEEMKTLRLFQRGLMLTKPGGSWMPFTAEQWFTTGDPGFFWTTEVQAAPGVSILARDKFQQTHGSMVIKALGLVTIADAAGPETDQGTIVRYLAELAWFPAAALDPFLHWEQIDSTHAKATITVGATTAYGVLTFNEAGDFVAFDAPRYYDRPGGATLELWHIELVSGGYREFQGVRIPAVSTVTWKLKDGDYTWLKLEVTDIIYNPPRPE